MTDQELFARRLRSARVMKQLSIDKLLDRVCQVCGLKISKAAISKYENALMLPSDEIRQALAKTLEVDVTYFFRPMVCTNDNAQIDFRKKSSMTVSEVNALTEKTKDKVERYMEIEQILRNAEALPASERLPKSPTIKTKDDVRKFAREVRKDWRLGIRAITNVQQVLEFHGIKVIPIEASKDFDGLSGTINGDNAFVAINSNPDKNHIERRRLTIMHELGHLLMNFDDEVTAKERESFCHTFANEFLLPTITFNTALQHQAINLLSLRPLQLQYGLSIDALMKKAEETGLINKSQYTYYNIKKSQKSFRDVVERSLFAEAPIYDRFASLVLRAYTLNLIDIGKAQSMLYDAPPEIVQEFQAL